MKKDCVCINRVGYCFIVWFYNVLHLGALLSWEKLPSQGELIPRNSKLLAYEHVFDMQSINDKFTLLSASFYQLQQPRMPYLFPKSLQGQLLGRTTRHDPIALSLLKLIKLSNSEPVQQLTWPHPCLLTKTTTKPLAHVPFLFLLPPDWHWCFPV